MIYKSTRHLVLVIAGVYVGALTSENFDHHLEGINAAAKTKDTSEKIPKLKTKKNET